jgi:Cu(I)/Ag(I) efflux system membrane fusion protein
MKRNTWLVSTAVALVVAGAAAASWWLGMQRGMSMQAAPAAAPAASADPSQWTIPQGEEATRRHIREGLKAGDVDPVTGQRITNYHDPMVPGKNFEAPGKSPFMEMMLVPRYAGAQGTDPGTVSVSPRIQQNLGLRTAAVVEGTLASEVRVVGTVAWNEREQVVVSSRANAMGFVEKLHVRATLDRVAAGAPLVELYLPEWVAAQEEYLAVARMSGAGVDVLRDAARARLRQAGMSEAQIERFVAGARVQARTTLTAPIGGVVAELMVREGATVMPGMALMKLQGTGYVWVEGEVPETQAASLRPGAEATATSPAVPGRTFRGRVQALLPDVNAATRTRKARLEVANAGSLLVPGMTVQLRFMRPEAKPTLMVPSDAVIHTGRRSVVMLAEDEGRFRPVEVTTGLESGGQTEIASGLRAGQRVVLSGQFLIDSEANLRGLEARLNEPSRQPAAAAEPAPVHRTDAVVTALDTDTATLDHPPIESLKWPQMVMDFRLPPAAQRPGGLAAGDRVRIEFRMQDGDVPRITSIERVAPAAAASGATK